MLYAASIKIILGKNHRRLDLVVEADTQEEAEIKALKQARKMYLPGKKAVYSIITMISETEAIEAVTRSSPETNLTELIPD